MISAETYGEDGPPIQLTWNEIESASADPEPFTFVYFGDAQNSLKSLWSRVVRRADLVLQGHDHTYARSQLMTQEVNLTYDRRRIIGLRSPNSDRGIVRQICASQGREVAAVIDRTDSRNKRESPS